METINFKIQGQHESHQGIATIIDTNSTYPCFNSIVAYGKMLEMAKEELGANVTVNEIGTAKKLESDGYTWVYDIYEAYVDSGSDDYQYFAIAKSCYE